MPHDGDTNAHGADRPGGKPPEGRERWEVRVEEGSPRGGLYELEQVTFFRVVDRRSGTIVKTFTGTYEASFTGEGAWGEGQGSGVRRVVVDEEGRCAFALHANRMVERFALGDEPVPDDPALPWRLAGLPLPALPTSVDGLAVDEGMDVEALVARVAAGWAPEQASFSHRELPASWLADLYLHLNGLPVASALSAAAARGLDGADDAARGLALCFFRRVPHAEGSGRVLEVVRARGAAEAVRPSPVRYGESGRFLYAPIDVFAALLDTSELDRFGDAVLRACGEAVLAPTDRFQESHLEAVARHAPGWLARHAPSVVRACPARLGPLLGQLYLAHRRDLVVSAGVALAQDPQIDRESLEAALRRLVTGEEMEAFRRAIRG